MSGRAGIEEAPIPQGVRERVGRSTVARRRKRLLDQVAPAGGNVGKIMSIALWILEGEDLDLEKEADEWTVRFAREDAPKILDDDVAIGLSRPAHKPAKYVLETALDLSHHLGNQVLLRSKIVEEHSGACAELGRKGPQGEIGDAV